MLEFKFILGEYAFSKESSPYDMGDMVVTGRFGIADSRVSPREDMMLYLAIEDLVNVVEILADQADRTTHQFDGIDGIFKLDFEKNDGLFHIKYKGTLIDSVPYDELIQSVLAGLENFISNHEYRLTPGVLKESDILKCRENLFNLAMRRKKEF